MRKYTVYDRDTAAPIPDRNSDRALKSGILLRWWVLEDGRLYAGFRNETAANAYARRMNQIQQRLHGRMTE